MSGRLGNAPDGKVLVVDLDWEMEELFALVDETCDLLSEYGVDFWVRWLRQRTETLRGEGPSGAGAFASGWGGMGGFLDLFIHHVNGHPIAEADIESVNGRLDQLQGEMYRKAERIRTHT